MKQTSISDEFHPAVDVGWLHFLPRSWNRCGKPIRLCAWSNPRWGLL